MAAIVLLLVFATALIGGPIAAAVTGHPLGALTQTIMTVSGVGIYLVCGIFMIITKLYRRTKASEAFVRTGWGGMKVVQDGGAIVIPFAHEVVPISLEVLKLQVARENADALITKDNLRADVHAEFFVRVQADEGSIQNAARSFGERMHDQGHVTKLVDNKLVNALRTAAATMTLQELNSNRTEFVKQVTETVKHDISPNGLTLESVSISKLDQTDPKSLRDDNIFDAQGKATIAKIVQERLTERNKLEKEGDQARAEQDVMTRKRILSLEQERAEAEANQKAQVASIQAEKDREAREAGITAERQVELATVEKQKQLEVATRQQQQATEVAERNKQKAITEAEQQLEVAKRKQQEAIAEAERQRAAKETELATAEAEREKAKQSITTVQVEAEAERKRKTQVIAAQGEAERKYVEAQRAADGEAYRMTKEAEGRKASADADAEATTKKATAEAEAKKAQAAGEQALQMVPVEVKNREVDVEQRRVEVLQSELQARTEYGDTMQKFELAKLEVIKRAEVMIANGQAMGHMLGQAQFQVFGTPEQVKAMTDSFARGMGISTAIDGFFAGASNETKEQVEGLTGQFSTLVQALAKRLNMTPEQLVAKTGTTLPAAPASSGKASESGNGAE